MFDAAFPTTPLLAKSPISVHLSYHRLVIAIGSLVSCAVFCYFLIIKSPSSNLSLRGDVVEKMAYSSDIFTIFWNGSEDRVIDDSGDLIVDGNPIQLYSSNGSPAQQFVITTCNQIQLNNFNKCLDIKDGINVNGNTLQLWTCAHCSDGNKNQYFEIPDKNTIGQLKWKGGDQTKCIDVTGGSQSQSVKLQIWDCNSGLNQQFKFISSSKPPSPSQAQPNPPKWPSSVLVFNPTSPNIQDQVNSIYYSNGGQNPCNHGEFFLNRYALLFKPGKYNVEVPVGYYTQVLGLGATVDEVVFTSAKGVYAEEGCATFSTGALCTFWRSAENFRTEANFQWTDKGMLWAVSQASPLRRIHVTNNLNLAQVTSSGTGYSSGGYMGNMIVDENVNSGSQQQWMTRNSKLHHWDGSNWNMVFVGNEGSPESHCSNNGGSPYVSIEKSPLVAEKPYISFSNERYFLNVPKAKLNSVGPDHSNNNVDAIDFENVYVATESDSAATINSYLAMGLHVVLSPGIYNLESALIVNYDNQVILGIGLATLVSFNGNICIQVANVQGVRIAGILFQAGAKGGQVLLRIGDTKNSGSNVNPTFLFDIFARVGGPDSVEVSVDVMVEVNSGFVVGDNLWLWRADHSVLGSVSNSRNRVNNGIVINGDDVTMYGLAVEHTLQDLTVWNGERGSTFFYQSELPYDVDQSNYGDKGFTSYRVASDVQEHSGYGIGVYHFFRDNAVTVQSGIIVPTHLESKIRSPLSVFLSGKGTMNHILNNRGDKSGVNISGMAKYLCDN